MSAMTKYDTIFESIQDKVNTGELTVAEARILNDIAYDKYVVENSLEYDPKKETEFLDKYSKGISAYKTAYLQLTTVAKQMEKLNKSIMNAAIKNCEDKLDDLEKILVYTPLLSKKAINLNMKFVKTLSITIASTAAIIGALIGIKKASKFVTSKGTDMLNGKTKDDDDSDKIARVNEKIDKIKSIDKGIRKGANYAIGATAVGAAGVTSLAGIIENSVAYQKRRDKFVQEQIKYITKCRISIEKIRTKSDMLLTESVDDVIDRCNLILETTGNNTVLKKSIAECKRDIKENKRHIENSIKTKDFKGAYKYINDTRKSFIKMKHLVHEVPTDAADDIIPHVVFFIESLGLSALIVYIGETIVGKIDKDKLNSDLVFEIIDAYPKEAQPTVNKIHGRLNDLVDKNKTKPNSEKLKDGSRAALKSIPFALADDAIFTNYRVLKAGDSASTNKYKNKAMIIIDKAIKQLNKLENTVRKAEAKYNNK